MEVIYTDKETGRKIRAYDDEFEISAGSEIPRIAWLVHFRMKWNKFFAIHLSTGSGTSICRSILEGLLFSDPNGAQEAIYNWGREHSAFIKEFRRNSSEKEKNNE